LYPLLKPFQNFSLDPAYPAGADLDPLGELSGRFKASNVLRGVEDKLLELTLRQYPHRGSPRERSIAMPRGVDAQWTWGRYVRVPLAAIGLKYPYP
jgi:hypothetical protein